MSRLRSVSQNYQPKSPESSSRSFSAYQFKFPSRKHFSREQKGSQMGLNAPMFTGIRKPIRGKKPELESLNEKIKQIGPYIENQKRQSIQRALKEQQKQRNKNNNELQSISSIMNQYKDSESVRSESVHRSRRESQIAIEMRSDIFKSCSSA
jgi:hypothetical protein